MTATKAKESSIPKASEKRGTGARRVYLVDGARTPFLKARGARGLSHLLTWRSSAADRC